jgi:hypothetical protein
LEGIVRIITITSAVIAQFLVFPLSAMTLNTIPGAPSRTALTSTQCIETCSVEQALTGNKNVTTVFKTSDEMPQWLVKKGQFSTPSNDELRALTVLRTV